MSNLAFLVYDISLTGGAEQVAINMANEFVKKHHVSIVSICESTDVTSHIDNSIGRYSLLERHKSITLSFLQLKQELRRILLSEKVDVLFAITAGVVTVATSAARNTSTKVVYCEHSNLENKMYGKKHEIRQLIGSISADKIVTLTERDKKNFIKMFKTNPKRLEVIPNWYTQNQTSASYDPDSKKIISVGRLENVKGYGYIIESAKTILARNPAWEWDIYGDGTLREQLQNTIEKEDIQRLTLKGNDPTLKMKYGKYAFLVMTSLYEGLPMALLEAQSANLPLISFDCPTGPSEIINDGVNGFIVKQGDVGELNCKIQNLIDSKEKRKDFSGHAKDGLNNFEKDNVLSKWNDLIDSLTRK